MPRYIPLPAARRPGLPSDKLRRRAGLAAAAVGGVLLPWSVVLATTLPDETRVRRWSLAWAGLDAGEGVAALATAALLARGDRRAAVPAAACGALLLADAWFDVTTSKPGLEHTVAVAQAATMEVPVALAAFWLAARLAASRDEEPAPGVDGDRRNGNHAAGRGQAQWDGLANWG